MPERAKAWLSMRLHNHYVLTNSRTEASLLPDGSDPGPRATQPGAIEQAFPPKETQSLEALQQLKLLCQVMDDSLGRQIELQESLDHDVKKVTFNDLWYIFKPGYEVRTPGDAQIQVYVSLSQSPM